MCQRTIADLFHHFFVLTLIFGEHNEIVFAYHELPIALVAKRVSGVNGTMEERQPNAVHMLPDSLQPFEDPFFGVNGLFLTRLLEGSRHAVDRRFISVRREFPLYVSGIGVCQEWLVQSMRPR